MMHVDMYIYFATFSDMLVDNNVDREAVLKAFRKYDLHTSDPLLAQSHEKGKSDKHREPKAGDRNSHDQPSAGTFQAFQPNEQQQFMLEPTKTPNVDDVSSADTFKTVRTSVAAKIPNTTTHGAGLPLRARTSVAATDDTSFYSMKTSETTQITPNVGGPGQSVTRSESNLRPQAQNQVGADKSRDVTSDNDQSLTPVSHLAASENGTLGLFADDTDATGATLWGGARSSPESARQVSPSENREPHSIYSLGKGKPKTTRTTAEASASESSSSSYSSTDELANMLGTESDSIYSDFDKQGIESQLKQPYKGSGRQFTPIAAPSTAPTQQTTTAGLSPQTGNTGNCCWAK